MGKGDPRNPGKSEWSSSKPDLKKQVKAEKERKSGGEGCAVIALVAIGAVTALGGLAGSGWI